MATTKKPTTAVAVKKSGGAVVDIQAQLAALAARTSGRTAPPTGNSIRTTQDKKFLLPDGTRTEGPIELVVVDFTSRNEYYEGSYDPNNITSPLCFAIHPEPKQMVPSANSPEKQCDDCASCPMNQFGSAGKGKACKNMRVLAVLPPDADESTPIWLLKVSPTGIKSFDAFAASCDRAKLPPVAFTVEVGFNESETYASLVFGDARPNENVGAHLGRVEEAEQMLAVEPDVNRQPAPKAPARAVARKPVGARR